MNDNTSYKNSALTYGLIYGQYSALLLYLNYKLNLENTVIVSFVGLVITFLIVFYPIHQYKLNNHNALKLGEAIKIGLIIGVVGGLIYALYTYFHFKQIEPEFITEKIQEAEKAVRESNKKMSEEELQVAINMSAFVISPFVLSTINLISLLLKSFFISLVVGIIKKQ